MQMLDNFTFLFPPEGTAAKLLKKCDTSHELMLSELHDGAICMRCFDCPFHCILDDAEEDVVRLEIDMEQGV